MRKYKNKDSMGRNKENMLITGVSGLLGNNLAYYFRDKYDILGLYSSHPVTIEGIDTARCELSHPGNIREIIFPPLDAKSGLQAVKANKPLLGYTNRL